MNCLRFKGRAMGALTLFLVGLAGQGWAFAPNEKNATYEIPLKSFDLAGYRSMGTSRRASETVVTLANLYGGSWTVASWNPQTNTPGYVLSSGVDLGQGLAADADVEQTARTVIRAAASALGVDPTNLRLDGVTRGMGKASAHFQQTYQGLDVWNGRVLAIFTEKGRLFVLGSDFYSDIAVDPQPTISSAQAEDIARSDLQFDPAVDRVHQGTKLLVLPVPLAVDAVRHHLVWRVRVQTEHPYGIWVTHVDAHSGEIVWRYNDISSEFSGDAYTHVQPDAVCSGEVQHGIRYAYVIVNGSHVVTDASGHWLLPGSGQAPVYESLEGPYCHVTNGGGPDAQYSTTVTSGVPDSHTWDDTNSQKDERNVFDAVSNIRDFFAAFDPGFSLINSQMQVIVSRNNGNCPCNAEAYCGDGYCTVRYIGLCPSSAWPGGLAPNCINSGEFQGIVAHEYGHHVQWCVVPGSYDNPGLNEGNPDVLANLITRDSVIGRGFTGDCNFALRNSQNNLIYPDDVIGQDEYYAGQVIAGFHWDATQGFRALYGDDAGILASAARWHLGRTLVRPRTQPDQVLATFIADDDDGNLVNGTPHFAMLCQAARNHNFICPGPGNVVVDFNYTGPEDGSFSRPFNTLAEGVAAVLSGGVVYIKTSTGYETVTITKPMTIRSYGGTAVIVGQ
jgi:hypothetical protein